MDRLYKVKKEDLSIKNVGVSHFWWMSFYSLMMLQFEKWNNRKQCTKKEQKEERKGRKQGS